MKLLGILAAASMALSPAVLYAGSGSQADAGVDRDDKGRPISGPLAGRVLEHSEVPVGAIVVGSLVLIGGVVVGVLASGGGGDSNNSTNEVVD